MDQGVIRSLKGKFCRKIIQGLIRAVDMKKKFPKTSVLDAIQILISSWSKYLRQPSKIVLERSEFWKNLQ